jgi:hypothetical protein
MRQPPAVELYDLQSDPFEFRDLSAEPQHADMLQELQHALLQWRRETGDPLLDPALLQRLTAEVQAVSDKAAGRQLQWGYPDYFFGREPAPRALQRKNRP